MLALTAQVMGIWAEDPERERKMAFVSTTHSHVTLVDRIALMAQNLRAYRARRAIYNQTFAELSALSDRDLTDLGMSRYDIPAVSAQAARG